MRAILLSILLSAAACGGWSRGDTLREFAVAGTTAADWAQTRGIVDQCAEQNPVIGACGERMSPDAYMPGVILLHLLVAAALPPRWRAGWQYLATGAEASQVWANYRDGFGFGGAPPPALGSASSVLSLPPRPAARP